MNSSVRHQATNTLISRAPYAAPHQATRAAVRDVLDSGTASGLAPFIPPGFRTSIERSRQTAATASSTNVRNVHAGTDTSHVDRSTLTLESPRLELGTSSAALPWIEEFAEAPIAQSDSIVGASLNVDDVAATTGLSSTPRHEAIEENWVLGEAGKRLNELTESLSSLDAARTAKEADQRALSSSHIAVNASDVPPDNLPMWGDDEWMDIMPSAAVPSLPESSLRSPTDNAESAARLEDDYNQQALEEAAAESLEMHARQTEAAAQVLEAVVRRIRAGDVPVPECEPEHGEAAVLAGVLASLLRIGR